MLVNENGEHQQFGAEGFRRIISEYWSFFF